METNRYLCASFMANSFMSNVFGVGVSHIKA